MKRYTRRMITVIFIAVFTLCSVLGVNAAPSPDNGGLISGAEPVDENGEKLDNPNLIVEVDTVPAKYADAVAKLSDDALLNSLCEGIIDTDNTVILDVKDVEAWMTDGSDVPFPLSIKIKIANIDKNTVAVILHYNEAKGGWEKLKCTVGNGYIIGTYESLSPVAVLVDKTTLKGNSGTKPVVDPSSKTGDQVPVLLLIVAAVLSFGAVVCLIIAKKKSKK